MSIGERIKNLRIICGLTQEELATAAGTKKQTIHKYETGIISNIPASKIKAMADKLKTTPAHLMGWTVAEETEKKNDAITGIILRLRSDDDFREVVTNIYVLPSEQFEAVKTFLSAFK